MPNRQPPTRMLDGITQDGPYGVFANSAMGEPCFYHQFFDDFDDTVSLWTAVSSGAASAAMAETAGDGGLALLTPGSAAAGYSYAQLPAASFLYTASYKMFFGARFTLTDSGGVSSPTVLLGLTQHQASATPAPTDGIYFQKNTATSYMDLIVNKSSTPVSVTNSAGFLAWNATTGAYSTALVSGTTYDCGFYIDFSGNIKGFFGTQLFGFMPQSGTGPYNTAAGSGNLTVSPPRGAQYMGQVVGGSSTIPTNTAYAQVTYPTANLSPMLSILAGDTNSPTLTVDFIVVQKER